MSRSFQQGLKKIIFLMFSFFQFSFAQLSIGMTAPNFSLPYLDAILNFNLSQNLGVRTIIYFWSPISEPQKEQMIMLKKFHEEYSAKGIKVIAILSFPETGDKDSAIKFIKRKAINFVNLIDDQKVAEKYGITFAPAVFILDENRTIIASGSEITEDLLEQIREEMEALLPVNFTSEPSGVSIFIEGSYKGKTPLRIMLKPGNYAVQVTGWYGYKDIQRKVTVTAKGPNDFHFRLRQERERIRLEPSPIPYGLAGASLNALAPGLGGVVFNGFSKESGASGYISIFSTAGFYLVGLFYLIDILAKPDNFLTSEDEKTYRNIVKIELYSTAGFYVLNLITGYLAGANYARRR